MAISLSAAADSFIRVKCYDADVGAQVIINGESKGECPVDVPVAPGSVRLQAQKIEGDYGRFFEKELSVIDGVPQRVDVMLSAPRLTSEGKRRQEAAEADRQLRAAEAGDIPAMERMVGYYTTGTGVAKDPDQAEAWRKRQAAAIEREQAQAAYSENIKAMNGDVPAMEGMVKRYETGAGVEADTAQAQMWRDKIDQAKKKALVEEKIRSINNEIHGVFFLEYTGKGANAPDCNSGNIPCIISTGLPMLLSGAVVDLLSTPIKLTKIHQLKNEAAMLASAWASPDSMMARVAAAKAAESARTTSALAEQ